MSKLEAWPKNTNNWFKRKENRVKDGIKKSEDHVEIIWKKFSVNARGPEVVQSWNVYEFKGNFSFENK